jgi:hypothetical protein
MACQQIRLRARRRRLTRMQHAQFTQYGGQGVLLVHGEAHMQAR